MKINSIVLILISLFFTSCGKFLPPDVVERAEPHFKTSDPYFNTYKQDFAEEYNIYTGKSVRTSVPINFSNDIFFPSNPRSIGVCFSTGGRGIEILIKESYWRTLSSVCRRQLIYHEMGHCMLNQDHRDGYPSVMNSSNGYCELYDNHENMFLEEFFTRSSVAINYLKSIL